MKRALGVALLLSVTLIAGACSRLQFGYSQAERVISWTLESYLPLDRRQSEALDRQLVAFKEWHCRSQLPGYAAWLRVVGKELAEGATAEQVEARFANVRYFLRLMAEDASPRLAGLSRTLDDRQIDELARAFDKANGKYRKEFVEVAYKDVASKRATTTRERLEFWIGPLTKPQRQAVERWSAGLEPAQADVLESRLRWQQSLRNTLARRSETEAVQSQLFTLMAEPDRTYTPELAAKLEVNRARTFAMVAEVNGLMTDAQRRKVVERTGAIAAELESLACPAPTRAAALTQ
jgi:hypothetical protein